tara:strand:- start:1150 stop:2916 length:1767 start_codon:yes stop_codon:yes gene_type:complete
MELPEIARLLKQELEWIPRGDLEFSILSSWSAGGAWYRYLPEPPFFKPEFSLHLLAVLAGHMNLYPEWKKLRGGLVRPNFYKKIDMTLFFVELRQARRVGDRNNLKKLYTRALDWPDPELIYWLLLKPSGWQEDHFFPEDEDPLLDQIIRFEDKKIIEKLRMTLIKNPPPVDMVDLSPAGFDTIAGALQVGKFLLQHSKIQWKPAKLYQYFRIGSDVVDRWLIREIIFTKKRALYPLVMEQFNSIDPVVNLEWLNLAIETNPNFPYRVQKDIKGNYEVLRRGFKNSIGQQFLVLEPGEFTVYDMNDQRVQVIQQDGVYLGVHEVTQAEWHKVMGHSDYKLEKGPKVHGLAVEGNRYPVHWVTWEMVQEFIDKLNKMESTNAYRLPYEMEWQRACSAGTRLPFGVSASSLNEVANYGGENSQRKLLPVGSLKPNPMGFHDLQGNVAEWTQDWFAYYPQSPLRNYKGPARGFSKVIRGGSYTTNQKLKLNCSSRGFLKPNKGKKSLGFRLIRSNPYRVPLPIRFIGKEIWRDGTEKARLVYRGRELVLAVGESLDEQVKLMSIKSLFVTVMDGTTGKRHAVYRNFQPITK